MAQGSQDKTESPSAKKFQDARKKGQIAKSRDLTSVIVLVSGGVVIYLCSNNMLASFRSMVLNLWSEGSFSRPEIFASGLFMNLMLSFVTMTGPVALAILVMSILVNFVQMKGFILSLDKLKFDLGRLNPLAGFKRMFTLRSLVELVKSILKMAIVGYAVYSVLWPGRAAMSELTWKDTRQFLSFTATMALKLLFKTAGYMLIVCILDSYYQKWQMKKDLMMTKQEVKEEFKQSEGNPQIKGKIRSLQRMLARKRMLKKVPKATVIITNPTHFAVALSYERGMEAPVVVAKGLDFLALKIIDTGRKHGVSIVRNPPLARALYKQVKLDEAIPTELYKAVAKILAYIFQQRQRKQNG